ncbi:MAG: Asp-tRNA(Asn)/Glu-tRNA(Gln) amidotransferase subunit GatC [Minisyncoccia bacterium]
MDGKINKRAIKHLAELSRIKLTEKEEEKILKDLQKIIDYFNELKTVDVSGVLPMTGGTNLKNIFRKDDEENPYLGKGKKSFPDAKNDFLKVPKII